MGDFLEYPEILQEVRGSMNPGRLRLQGNQVIFRNQKTGKVDTYPGSEVEKAHWLIRARGYCLKLIQESGLVHRYDGFKETDFDKVSAFLSENYQVKLTKKDLSLKGWNWGVADFIGNSLDFKVDNKASFEIPLNYVSHSTTSKNEVTLEFHQNDDAPVSLMEVRFHIPSKADEETDPVVEFYNSVMDKADIIQVTGDSICIFPEVQCLTPRGRYDIKIFPTFMQLHGRTYDFKIPYTSILRLFLLPHRDGRQMFFVVSLDPPIKHGQTRYHFVIVVFNKDDESTVELSLPEQDIEEKYEGKLQKEMSGPEYEIVSRIMKTLVNRKITVPGTFLGNTGTHSIACSYKASTGFLYPLERGFIFVHKPPVHVRFDEIACVNFARSSGSLRSFDFEVETKAGTTLTFVGMEKEEYQKLYDFVHGKKLQVKNIGSGKMKDGYNEDIMGSDDDAENDPYLERMKREAEERDEDDEDEDESEDSDFNPDAEPNAGEEEPDDEFDSNVSETESEEGESDDSETKARREKKKKQKEKKKTRTVHEPGTRKKRGSKKNKDPNKPKHYATAYFIWMSENREKIKTENPGASVTEVAKIGGQLWGKVTDKSKWEALSRKDKERYEKEMADYIPPEDDDGDEKPKKERKKASKVSAKSSSPSKSGGAGTGFKSKEFISDSDSEESDSGKKGKKAKKPKKGAKKEEPEDEEMPSDSESDTEKKKKKPSKRGAKKGKEESDVEMAEESDSDSGKAKRSKRSTRGTKKDASDMDLPSDVDNHDNLPSDEEILSGSAEGSGSEEESEGKGSGSGSESGSDD